MIEQEVENTRNFKIILFLNLMLMLVENETKQNESNLIYILIWTDPTISPFMYMGTGQEYFTNKSCRFQNCFITCNRTYFRNVIEFDVVLFNVVTLAKMAFPLDRYTFPLDPVKLIEENKPQNRSENQNYVFVSDEPPALYAIHRHYNNFFNYTWTYKLDSDVTMKYFIIRNKNGKVIGPAKDMNWIHIHNMKPTSKRIQNKLQSKKKPAVWFATDCPTPSQRENYVNSLQDELKYYNLNIDTFGHCGQYQCPKHKMEECHAFVESDYYFYLAFENSMSEDYVTEKVLTALEHYTVPIVFGGANYTRFIPKGIYLDADKLGPTKLAKEMNDTIHNETKYYDFFKWHNHYSFHASNASADTDEICAFCAFLNEKKLKYTRSVYRSISTFWLS